MLVLEQHLFAFILCIATWSLCACSVENFFAFVKQLSFCWHNAYMLTGRFAVRNVNVGVGALFTV